MLSVENEWRLQVADAKEFLVQVFSTHLVALRHLPSPSPSPMEGGGNDKSIENHFPTALVASVLLSSSVNSDNEPVCIYFDASQGFAFMREDVLDVLEEDAEADEHECGAAMPVDALQITSFVSSSFHPSLVSLIQSTPMGANAFGDALAAALLKLQQQAEE